MKRHRWRRYFHFNVCDDCGCRYRRGSMSRIYEHPDGRNTSTAGECMPDERKIKERWLAELKGQTK